MLRDMDTSALINKDVQSYEQYKENRDRSQRVENLCTEVDNIKCELSDIKALLLQFMGGKNK